MGIIRAARNAQRHSSSVTPWTLRTWWSLCLFGGYSICQVLDHRIEPQAKQRTKHQIFDDELLLWKPDSVDPSVERSEGNPDETRTRLGQRRQRITVVNLGDGYSLCGGLPTDSTGEASLDV